MTERQFEQASLILKRISSIDKMLDALNFAFSFQFAPPTRMSGVSLVSTSKNFQFDLSERETMTIVEALMSQKEALQREFEQL